MTSRRSILKAALALPVAALLPDPAQAAEPPVFAAHGLAIRGADPVAYFLSGGPVAGSERHALIWGGASWFFASSANRQRFEADPRAYAPRFGGYCAWAVSRGYLASTDPSAWTIHGGRLYLNYSRAVRRRFLRDLEGNISRAEANWPAILSG